MGLFLTTNIPIPPAYFLKGHDKVKWTKVKIHTSPQCTEEISGILMEQGIYGVEIIDPQERANFLSQLSPNWDYVDEALLLEKNSHKASNEAPKATVVFYLDTDNNSQALLSQVREKIHQLYFLQSNGISKTASIPSTHHTGSPTITTEIVDDQDWLHEWKKHFHPIQIGNVLIVPEWDTASHNSEIIFKIDPGSAFGTGQHATTVLCIEALQQYINSGDAVLDIGCGSGILSIISLLLDAKKVVACDIDPAAVSITKKNAALNPINQSALHVYVGDILTNRKLQSTIALPENMPISPKSGSAIMEIPAINCDMNGKYSIVIANIVADVIIGLVPLIQSYLKPGGLFIASGIITERLNDVINALTCASINIVETKTSDGWCCVVAR